MRDRDVLVLCYHAVSNRWTAHLSVHPDLLARQLETLVRRGYQGATFTQAVTSPPAKRTLAVTFDDGYRSVFQFARPILSRLGLPGTVFVPTDFPDSDRPLSWPGIDHWLEALHAGELRPPSWEELRGLAEEGWEVGSHACSHRKLPELDETSLVAELAGSRARCQQGVGRECTSIAYPYGEVDDRVVAAAQRAGYRAGAALPGRLYPARPLEWPRVGIFREDTSWRVALKVSPTFRRLRLWPPAGAAVSRLAALQRR